MANSVNVGANELIEQTLEAIWSSGKQSMKVAGASHVPTSRRPHVVTSQRRDVGSTNTIVNKQ